MASLKSNMVFLKEYALQDSVLLYRVLRKLVFLFQNSLSVDMWRYRSIGAIALGSFKIRYPLQFKQISNNVCVDERVYKLVRDSYRGGIIDLYSAYGENVYHYDVNSSYSAAMLKKMPIGEPKELCPNLATFDLNSFFGFLEVTIQVHPHEFPFLGTVGVNSAITIYPVGIFKISVFSEELKYALTVNHIDILCVHRLVSYKAGYIFQGYVHLLHTKKRNTSSAGEAYIYKLLLNSLYGRLGIQKKFDLVKLVKKNTNLSSFDDDFLSQLISDMGDYSLVSFSNKTYCQKDNLKYISDSFNVCDRGRFTRYLSVKEKYIFSAPQVSSAICAYARIHIDSLKRKLWCSGYTVYYSDTDSIFTN